MKKQVTLSQQTVVNMDFPEMPKFPEVKTVGAGDAQALATYRDAMAKWHYDHRSALQDKLQSLADNIDSLKQQLESSKKG